MARTARGSNSHNEEQQRKRKRLQGANNPAGVLQQEVLGGILMSSLRIKPLYLMKILLEYTDEQNTMTMSGLIAALSAYGIKAEHKPLYEDMEALRQYGEAVG